MSFSRHCILFADILYPKIVDNEDEGDGASFVNIQIRVIFRREIFTGGKDIFELLICKLPGQFEAIHYPSDFNVDEAIGTLILYVLG